MRLINEVKKKLKTKNHRKKKERREGRREVVNES